MHALRLGGVRARIFAETGVTTQRTKNGMTISELLAERATGVRNFCGADLRGADLCLANLSGCDFTQALLDGANLQSANCRGAIFNHATLTDANMSFSNLSGASFLSASLESVNLSYAGLVLADMRNAELSNAKFMQSCILHASLDRAKIDMAKGIYRIGRQDKSPIYAVEYEGRLCVRYDRFMGSLNEFEVAMDGHYSEYWRDTKQELMPYLHELRVLESKIYSKQA